MYEVKYKNPNNIVMTDKIYTYETRRKSELDAFLKEARQYSGSYQILSVEKISEAKNKRQGVK